MSFPLISLTDAVTGKRVRVSEFQPGDALVQPILGYHRHEQGLTVYVNGSMPLAMRSAQEDGRLDHEQWLVDTMPTGIREIDWTDCRQEFSLLKAA